METKEIVSNSWWEIQVLGNPVLEEQIFWRLQRFGCQGTATQVTETNSLTKAYLPSAKASFLDLAALSLWLKQDAIAADSEPPRVKWHLINEEDWSSSWKQHWAPQEIGDQLIIIPAWLEAPADNTRLVVRLDPGSAFGTGNHPTTQLSLEALEMRLYDAHNQNLTFADIGCGSGILAIAAVLLGATKSYAIDTDIMAVKATNENRELNHIPAEKIWVGEGSLDYLLENIPEPVDGFACNIIADVILGLIPSFQHLIKPNGWGILSGILLSQVHPIVDALESHGWVVGTLWKLKDWTCLTIRRS
ncbi:ribosomal protein L11 methyltransferase [Synechococcus sp. PCC 7502]|uniref:50S ribosomal protein L11 methyltransferase n=1 Tax=Synechococcus sp. PCC 7502 TaxID=1173263 RepID=UPI0002A000F6|nr:50S ribosomal protein L11 methyltransferase [Synechococcus sp. PCC 7502]AFY73124.1 ribosomal protein L11 methyltransferase [Synechococcus sp. PCC 7502]